MSSLENDNELIEFVQEGGVNSYSWPLRSRVKFNNWFVLSVRISSYGCTREVWRAREKRKGRFTRYNFVNQRKFSAILVFFPTSVFRLQNMADFHFFLYILLIANQIMVPFFNIYKKHSLSRKRYLFISC